MLDRSNAALYWERESRHDTVISLTYGRPALDALCRVIEAWVLHFLGIKVAGQADPQDRRAALGLAHRPRRRVDRDPERAVGGREIEHGRMRNILAIFALQFEDPAAMRADIAGRTVYLALACEDGVVRMKPQNLLTNLPLA